MKPLGNHRLLFQLQKPVRDERSQHLAGPIMKARLLPDVVADVYAGAKCCGAKRNGNYATNGNDAQDGRRVAAHRDAATGATGDTAARADGPKAALGSYSDT